MKKALLALIFLAAADGVFASGVGAHLKFSGEATPNLFANFSDLDTTARSVILKNEKHAKNNEAKELTTSVEGIDAKAEQKLDRKVAEQFAALLN